jgi:hypothetical protein
MKLIRTLLFILFPPAMLPYYKRKCQALIKEHEVRAQELIDSAKKLNHELIKGNFRVQPEHETEFVFEA